MQYLKSLRWLNLYSCFWTFDQQNFHMMFAIMLDSNFKSLWVVDNYVGRGEEICLVFKYYAKVVVPLFMICVDWLNPTSQTCATITNVPFFCLKKKKSNMFGVKASMEGGANRITWTTPTPLGDYLWGAYFGIFLEYFEQKSFKKSWKLSSHYYVMVYIKNCYKYIIFKKSSPFTKPFTT